MSKPDVPVRFRAFGSSEPWHDLRPFKPDVPETVGGVCGEPFVQPVPNSRPSSTVATVETDPQPRCSDCVAILSTSEA